jgi:hypothetical protein
VTRNVIRRTRFLSRIAVMLMLVPAFVSGQRTSRADHPTLEGIWTQATTASTILNPYESVG